MYSNKWHNILGYSFILQLYCFSFPVRLFELSKTRLCFSVFPALSPIKYMCASWFLTSAHTLTLFENGAEAPSSFLTKIEWEGEGGGGEVTFLKMSFWVFLCAFCLVFFYVRQHKPEAKFRHPWTHPLDVMLVLTHDSHCTALRVSFLAHDRS